jgi:peptidoglycan/LPS O-acetylase OafA/YrhL
VWPLHIVMLAVIVATMFYIRKPPEMTLWTMREGINPIITNIFLVHAMGFHRHLLLNVPSWSISVEFFAYVTFAILAVWLRRFMPAIAAVLIVASLAILYFFAERYMDTHADLGFFRCLAGFFSGYFMYLAWRRFGGVENRAAATALEVAVIVAACWFVTIAGNGTSAVSLLAPLFFAPVVFVFAAERGLVSSLLKRQPFPFLGDTSYSIYLTHYFWVLTFPFLIAAVSRAWGYPIRLQSLVVAPPTFGTNLKIAIAFVAYFALIIATSALTWWAIEQPGRRFFRRLSDRIGTRRRAGEALAET